MASCRLSSGAAVTFAPSKLCMRAGAVIASSALVEVTDKAILNAQIEVVNRRCIESA
jgi:hypothetical protein